MDIHLNFRTEASAVVLLGALGLLGAPGTASAVPMACPEQNVSPGPIQTSAVTDAVTDLGGGSWGYEFRVCNTSAFSGDSDEGRLIRDWELPFFGTDLFGDNEAGIADIVTPEGWSFTLEAIGVPDFGTGWDGVAEWQDPGDPFFDPLFADHTHVLHFFTDCFEDEFFFCEPISPGDGLDGFGFTAGFSPTGAPYQASWIDAPAATGDPAFPLGGFPASPSLLPPPTDMPEPGTLALIATGALLGGAMRGRKRRSGKDN